MHIGEAALADKAQALVKFFLTFPGECHDHVRGHGAAGEVFLQQRHALKVPGGVVLALHPRQHRVAAGLHGKMELGAQVRKRRHFFAEIRRDDARLQRAQPHPALGHSLANRIQKF